MKKILLFTGVIIFIVFSLGQAAPFVKVSPPQGNSPQDPILASPGSAVTVTFLDLVEAQIIITSSSGDTSSVTVFPPSALTSIPGEANFIVSFKPGSTSQSRDVILTFSSGPDSVQIYVRKISTIPSFSAYGFCALALLLACAAVWVFRKREARLV
ncbi:MAG: hypothetical protein ACRECJ_07955 [Limisphaerales bacterium]